MSAITITAANVVPGAGAEIDKSRNAGATITAGQAVYLDESTNTYKLADANLSAAASVVAGIALNGASAGQPLAVLTGGLITIGATLTKGTIYVLGATAAGDISPAGDLTTGWYRSIIGVATTTAVLAVKIFNSGVTD